MCPPPGRARGRPAVRPTRLPDRAADGKIPPRFPEVTPGGRVLSVLDQLRPAIADELLPAVYRRVSVDPERFLAELRSRGVEVQRIDDLATLDAAVRERVARSVVTSSRRISALSGVGLGMAGWMAVPPEIAHQLVRLLQLAQRLSLLWGMDFRTTRGEIELWKAIADGVGVTVQLEGTPTDVARRVPLRLGRTSVAVHPIAARLAQAVARRLAVRLYAPLGRMVPLVGGGIGAWSNYAQMGRAGRRMMAYYRQRHAGSDVDRAGAIEVDVVRATAHRARARTQRS